MPAVAMEGWTLRVLLALSALSLAMLLYTIEQWTIIKLTDSKRVKVQDLKFFEYLLFVHVNEWFCKIDQLIIKWNRFIINCTKFVTELALNDKDMEMS